MTLIECLVVAFVLTVLATAQLRAMTHLRQMHAMASEREAVVRDAHAIVEELRAGARALPSGEEAESFEWESGSFSVARGDCGVPGVARIVVSGRRETPEGTIAVDLPVLLRGSAGQEVSHE